MIAWQDWKEEPIGKQHDRKNFDCGQAELNKFLHHFARQSHERGASKTFLAVDRLVGNVVYGFYSLSPASIKYVQLPELAKRGLARYDADVFRLSRLAVASHLQGQGFGAQLLLAAGRRCLRVSAEVGGTAILIDAKDARVATWYASYGALPLIDAPLTLILPLATIAIAFTSKS